MRIVPVCVYSPAERVYRLCRLVGTVGKVGDGRGYSYKLSLGLSVAFPFVRVRLHRAYGGVYT